MTLNSPTVSWIVCKAFLQKCPQEKQQQLLRFLPPSEERALSQLPSSFYRDPSQGFLSPGRLLKTVHFSWFAPVFRSLSENEIRLFLAALDPEQMKGLKKLLLFANHSVNLSAPALSYIEQTLWEKISSGEHFPMECLPDSPLNVLLDFEFKSLLLLIDFLGIHDLALEVRKIIETAKLKQVYAALNPSELSFLKTLLLRKEPLTFKKMGLQSWDGKKNSLRALVHQRGLNRLAKALYSSEPALLWHVSHRLDMERGELLLKLATPIESARAQAVLIEQVIELLELIKTQQTSGEES
jgi:hypothetical protein